MLGGRNFDILIVGCSQDSQLVCLAINASSLRAVLGSGLLSIQKYPNEYRRKRNPTQNTRRAMGITVHLMHPGFLTAKKPNSEPAINTAIPICAVVSPPDPKSPALQSD